MGVDPALRRQLASTPRRLASSNSQSSSHQGGHNNGARVAADAWKPLPHVDDVNLARLQSEIAAECEAVREAFKEEVKNRRFIVGTCFTGVGMVLLTMWHTAYTETQRTKYLRSKHTAYTETQRTKYLRSKRLSNLGLFAGESVYGAV